MLLVIINGERDKRLFTFFSLHGIIFKLFEDQRFPLSVSCAANSRDKVPHQGYSLLGNMAGHEGNFRKIGRLHS